MSYSEITVRPSVDGEVYFQVTNQDLQVTVHLASECARSLAAKLIEAADESDELGDME